MGVGYQEFQAAKKMITSAKGMTLLAGNLNKPVYQVDTFAKTLTKLNRWVDTFAQNLSKS